MWQLNEITLLRLRVLDKLTPSLSTLLKIFGYSVHRWGSEKWVCIGKYSISDSTQKVKILAFKDFAIKPKQFH